MKNTHLSLASNFQKKKWQGITIWIKPNICTTNTSYLSLGLPRRKTVLFMMCMFTGSKVLWRTYSTKKNEDNRPSCCARKQNQDNTPKPLRGIGSLRLFPVLAVLLWSCFYDLAFKIQDMQIHRSGTSNKRNFCYHSWKTVSLPALVSHFTLFIMLLLPADATEFPTPISWGEQKDRSSFHLVLWKPIGSQCNLFIFLPMMVIARFHK